MGKVPEAVALWSESRLSRLSFPSNDRRFCPGYWGKMHAHQPHRRSWLEGCPPILREHRDTSERLKHRSTSSKIPWQLADEHGVINMFGGPDPLRPSFSSPPRSQTLGLFTAWLKTTGGLGATARGYRGVHRAPSAACVEWRHSSKG